MYLERTLNTFFEKANTQFPVLLVTGARQVGKTTLLRHLVREPRAYVTLDDPLILSLAKSDPALFMQRFPAPILIDEIQYAAELLPYIKMAVDQNPRPGAYWLTGSQPFHLMQGVSESLAGRVGIIQLLGLSRREKMGQGYRLPPFLPTTDGVTQRLQANTVIDLPSAYEMIWRGSFPRMATSDSEAVDRDLFFSSYVQTYLQRDVRSLARVGNEMTFLRFLRAAAARSGQLLNIADFARDADVAPNTAKSWLSILQGSNIIYLLEPYYSNVTKRLIKAPKLYFLDTGLCAWLTQWSSPQTLEAGAASGAFLETWIVGELLKSWFHNGRIPPFYYYRDKDQKEIDLLIVQDNVIYPLEFKKSASPNTDAVRHFQVLDKLNLPVGPGGVVCLAPQYLPLTSSTSIIPLAAL